MEAGRAAPWRAGYALPQSAATPARVALAITALWRLGLALAGIAAKGVLPAGRFTSFSLLRHEHWPANPLTLVLDAAVRNDALWYAGIAEHGYTYSARHTSSIAFYPLYPLLIRLLAFVVHDVFVAGVLISTVCLLLIGPLLYCWLADRGQEDRAVPALFFLLLFPGAVFFAAMYSEALYLVLALGVFLAYERRQWTLAALCAFLLALSRPTGILVLPSLVLLLWRSGLVREPRAWLPLAAGPLALALFSLYQYVAFGTPFAAIKAARVPPWSRGLGQALRDVTLHSRPGFGSWYFLVMLVLGVLVLATVPLVWRRFGAAYALFAALTVVGPAASGLLSLERYLSVDFPVFAALGCSLGGKARFGVLLGGAYFLVFFMAAFAAGWGVF